MNPSTLAENEFILIREISRQPISTQRDLSHHSGLSLGMTNLLLKRLARKGLIKVKQIDWKRTQYLLTPKGAVEKTRKMYDYTRYTVRLFRQIQENVTTALRREYDDGRRTFWIVAQDELAGVLSETLAGLELPDASVSFAPRFSDVPANADLVLTATQESSPARPGLRVVSLVDFLDVHFRLP